MRPRSLVAGLFTAALVTACGAVEPSPEPPTVTPHVSIPASPSPQPTVTVTPASPTPQLTLADAAQCPVTQPTTTPPEIGDRLFGSHAAYGNDDLWVGGLGLDGIMVLSEEALHSDGSVGTKLGWWRNVPGSVVITGRRLDAAAPAMFGQGSEGHGSIGFQSSGVTFPTEGCWEVTADVGDGAPLTFVTFVIIEREA